MVYRYGMQLGVKLLFKGRVRQSLPFLIRPVNYWRALEYGLVMDEACFQPGDRILDIGSPKLLSLYLAKKVGASVFATDVDSYFIQNYSFLRLMEAISPDQLYVGVEDGRTLGFAEGAFNKIYSISVLEHIPGDGDSICAREIGRVLAKGGEAYITVPCWRHSREEYVSPKRFYWASHSQGTDETVFYQRRYSEQDLYRRIIEPSGLKLKKLLYVGERVMYNSEREFSDYLPVITGPIQPLLSRAFHTAPTSDWKAIKKPLCGMIVLEK